MDYNVIQAPELLRRLAQRLGLREAHVSSTLQEGMVAAIIVDDLTERGDTTGRALASDVRAFTVGATQTSIAANDPFVQLSNTLQNDVAVRRFRVSHDAGTDQIVRLRWGIRNAVIGGAPSTGFGGFMNGARFNNVGAGPISATGGQGVAPSNQATLILGESFVAGGRPQVFELPSLVLQGKSTNGLVVQTLNPAAAFGVIQLAVSFDCEEMVQ